MSESLNIDPHISKSEKYISLLPQLQALIAGENDLVSNLANLSAALRQTFGWFWVGFYIVKNNELVLGPFQGTIACTRIKQGKGVCGAAWERRQSLLVLNVEEFPGHIACSSQSVAEIVVPIFNASSEVIAVLDVDSDCFGVLDEVDLHYLEDVCKLTATVW